MGEWVADLGEFWMKMTDSGERLGLQQGQLHHPRTIHIFTLLQTVSWKKKKKNMYVTAAEKLSL
jgi:hypothetical protein